MIDMNSTIWYADLAQFQVYRNRKMKRNNIIKGLLQVMNKMMSLGELNLLAVMHKLLNQSKDEGIKYDIKIII